MRHHTQAHFVNETYLLNSGRQTDLKNGRRHSGRPASLERFSHTEKEGTSEPPNG